LQNAKSGLKRRGGLLVIPVRSVLQAHAKCKKKDGRKKVEGQGRQEGKGCFSPHTEKERERLVKTKQRNQNGGEPNASGCCEARGMTIRGILCSAHGLLGKI